MRRLMVLVTLLALTFAAAGPASDASAAVKKCPANTSGVFFANPAVKRRPAGLKPTGVRTPAVCSYPTLTKALAAAASGNTVVATGGTDSKPATFKKETFPITVPVNVDVTTSDDPGQGGSNFAPQRYVVRYTGGTQALDLNDQATFGGMTIANRRTTPGTDLFSCSQGTVVLHDAVLDGAPASGAPVTRGVRLSRDCVATVDRVTVRNFGVDGVVVDTGGATTLHDLDVHNNGHDGVVVVSAPAGVTLSAERPTLRSLAMIHDNGRNGIVIGDPDKPSSIVATIGDQDVFNNGNIGIVVADQGRGTSDVSLLDDDVYTNGANGALVHPSTISFAQSKFHNNGLNQLVFDGGGRDFAYTVDSPTGMSDAGSNAVYCYASKQVFGIFAQGLSHVTVQHTEFEGGGAGLKDYGAQSGSTISVTNNAPAITVCP